MSSFYGKEFDDAIWHLRKEFQHDRIRVRTVEPAVLADYHGHGACGDATENLVTVSRGMALWRATETLVHEYAHALHVRHNPTFRDAHSDEWGKFYARCYRAVYGD